MSFYQIQLRVRQKYNWSSSLLIYSKVFSLQQEIIVLIFQDGTAVLVSYDSLQVISQTKLSNNNKALTGILQVTQYETLCMIQTFKNIYLLHLEQLLNIKQNGNLQVIALQFNGKEASQQYSKLTSKQAKLVKFKEKIHVKLVGRLNQQLYYYFSEIVNERLILKEYFRYPLANQYKISLQPLNKDLLIYQSYCNKFKPIKVQILNYFTQTESKDTSIMKKLQIIQFEQRCVVNNAYLIGINMVCLVTNSHFQQKCQSNIILFNYHQGYTVNNIAINDLVITQVFLFGNRPDIQYKYNDKSLTFQCVGISFQQKCIIQIFPLCTFHPQKTHINESNYHKIQQNSLVLYNKSQSQLIVYSKISKKAIYYSWLRQKYSGFSSIFNEIMQLLD